MKLFQIEKNNQLTAIKEKRIKLEKDLQELIEANVDTLFNLTFVKSEAPIKSSTYDKKGRVDTLCFDKKKKAFVAIEYKRKKNADAILQSLRYLDALKERKNDCLVYYNEELSKSLQRKDIKGKPRLIIIAPSFAEDQKSYIYSKYRDAVDLYKITHFANQTITLQKQDVWGGKGEEEMSKKENTSIKIKGDRNLAPLSLQARCEKMSPRMKSVFEDYHHAFLKMEGIKEVLRQNYVGYNHKDQKRIVDIQIQKESIQIYINLKQGALQDPKKLFEDVSRKGHHGNGDYRYKATDTKDMPYVMQLVAQSYAFHKAQ